MRLPKIKDKRGRPLDYRQWQKEALTNAIERIQSGGVSFFPNVCPGGGKTPFGVAFAKYCVEGDYIDKVLVMAPRQKIRDQWMELLMLNGLTAEQINREQAAGRQRSGNMPKRAVVMTYQMTTDPFVLDYIKLVCTKYRTMVIGDEIHWTGVHDHLHTRWGDCFREATASARFVLPMSGTPFREDFYRLPFLHYKDGEGEPDYNFSYRHALDAGDVTPIFFEDHTGIINFTRRSAVGDVVDQQVLDFAEDDEGWYFCEGGKPDDVKMNQRLLAALQNGSGFWRAIMDSAIAKLDQIRRSEHPHAGGIVFARDQEHARAIAGYIAKTTKRNPRVIISDEDRDIDSFAESSTPWVVSVRMINEGVDIERLRVGVLLTTITTRKHFMQSVARCIRIDASMISAGIPESKFADEFRRLAKRQWAFIFMPADPRFKQWAIEFKKAINDQQLEPPQTRDLPGTNPSERLQYDVDDADTDLGGATFGEEYWTADELRGSVVQLEGALGQQETDLLRERLSESELGAIVSAIIRKQRAS